MVRDVYFILRCERLKLNSVSFWVSHFLLGIAAWHDTCCKDEEEHKWVWNPTKTFGSDLIFLCSIKNILGWVGKFSRLIDLRLTRFCAKYWVYRLTTSDLAKAISGAPRLGTESYSAGPRGDHYASVSRLRTTKTIIEVMNIIAIVPESELAFRLKHVCLKNDPSEITMLESLFWFANLSLLHQTVSMDTIIISAQWHQATHVSLVQKLLHRLTSGL